MNKQTIYFQTFVLFFSVQSIGYDCLAKTNTLQKHSLFQKILCNNEFSFQYQTEQSRSQKDKPVKQIAAVIENRFIARGKITDIKPESKGTQKFTLQIEKIEQYKDYPNFGRSYLEKCVEVYSDTGIPTSFQVEAEVSIVLRVSGDEHGQVLFLVEVIENG